MHGNRVPIATYFFAQDPRFVELEVEYAPEPPAADPAPTAEPPVTPPQVRVAVGPTHLRQVSAADTPRGVRLRFEPAAPLRAGLHVIFVAFGPDTDLARPRSDYKLHAIRWR